MAISASDVIPLSHARANFSELAEDVRAGAEKIITKNGEAFIAIIESPRLSWRPVGLSQATIMAV